MTANEIWRAKADEDVVRAAQQLDDYTEAGQQIILAELTRRGLTARGGGSDTPPLSGETDGASTINSALQSHNVVSRFWHGGVSLPITYWIWGVVGTRLVSGLANLAMNTTGGSWIVGLAGFACYLAYFFFFSVGLWRSSAAYRGRRIWADLSRVSLALGIILSLAEAFVAR